MGEAVESNGAKSRAAEKSTDHAGRSRTMGKETKIGLGVIGVLLVVFAGVLIVRLRNSDPARQPGGVADLVSGDESGLETDAVDPPANKKSADRGGRKIAGKQTTAGRDAGRENAWSSRKPRDDGTASQGGIALGGGPARRASDSPSQPSSSGRQPKVVIRQPSSSNGPRRSTDDPWQPDDGSEEDEPFDPTEDAWADDQTGTEDTSASSDEEYDPYTVDDEYAAEQELPSSRLSASKSSSRGSATSTTSQRSRQSTSSPADVMPGYDDEDAHSDDWYAHEEQPATELAAPQQNGRFRPAAASRGVGPDIVAEDGQRAGSRATRPQGMRNAPSEEYKGGGEFADDEVPQASFPQEESYTVQPNDNYWSISRAVYGTGAYFKALYEHNRDRYPFPDQLRAGDVIYTPPATVLQQTYPDLCPQPRRNGKGSRLASHRTRPRPGSRTYVVREGDTLFDIARSELGRASRWAELYELNRDVLGDDFDYLTPGMELLLPADVSATEETEDESDSVTTQRPRRPYQR